MKQAEIYFAAMSFWLEVGFFHYSILRLLDDVPV